MSSRRGSLICLEGVDRAGKSTQAAMVVDRFKSQPSHPKVELIKFPDRTTPIGQMIDSYLRSQSDLDDRVIHLLFSANRWECASKMVAALEAGTTIVCDRYAFSGLAFSAAKAGLPYEWCRAPDISLPAPDLTIFLDVRPEVAKSRGGYGEERYEKESMQRAVRDVFARIGSESSGIHSGDDESNNGLGRWMVIDAGKTIDEVAEEVWAAITAARLNDGTFQPVGKLWEAHLVSDASNR